MTNRPTSTMIGTVVPRYFIPSQQLVILNVVNIVKWSMITKLGNTRSMLYFIAYGLGYL
jgi:hypothetical protein